MGSASPHFFLLATDLEAKEVIATGYGTTVEQALQNAKTLAIEQVASTFSLREYHGCR